MDVYFLTPNNSNESKVFCCTMCSKYQTCKAINEEMRSYIGSEFEESLAMHAVVKCPMDLDSYHCEAQRVEDDINKDNILIRIEFPKPRPIKVYESCYNCEMYLANECDEDGISNEWSIDGIAGNYAVVISNNKYSDGQCMYYPKYISKKAHEWCKRWEKDLNRGVYQR